MPILDMLLTKALSTYFVCGRDKIKLLYTFTAASSSVEEMLRHAWQHQNCVTIGNKIVALLPTGL